MSVFMLIAGCSGGTGGSSSVLSLSQGATATESLQISNASIALSATTPVTATFLDLKGNPIANLQVTFSTNLGSLNPTSGIATTDASGVATVQLNAGATAGAGLVTTTASVAGVKMTQVAAFTVALPVITVSTPVLGLANLAPGGSTSVTVTLTDASGALFTTPVDVSFSSNFVTSGKATVITPVRTVNGVASSTYTAAGGVGSDTITAFVGSNTSLPALVTVAGAAANSISFISATPENIALRGMGGVGSVETSTIVFKVLDTNGQPKSGQTVDFTPNTTVGGLNLTSLSASSDQNGLVSTIVQSGNIATPIRVTATIRGSSPIIATQSDQLVVSTGIPTQDGMSLAVANHNVESYSIDGVTDVFTVFLADHYGNPVPDGTAVSFSAQSGQIQPSCTTVNGRCSTTWTSSGARTADGRNAILAYAIGEESFADPNANGVADGPSQAVCLANNGGNLQVSAICGEFTDTTQAWRDDAHTSITNLNGVATYAGPGTFLASFPNFQGDLFIDFNGSGKVDRDGVFDGISRPAGTPPSTKHVFQNNVFIISTSGALINNLTNAGGGFTINAAAVAGTAVTTSLFGSVQDRNPLVVNPMPSGTSIALSSLSPCLIPSPTSFTVPNTVNGPTSFSTVVSNSCVAGSSGTISVTVTSPAGLITIKNFNFNW